VLLERRLGATRGGSSRVADACLRANSSRSLNVVARGGGSSSVRGATGTIRGRSLGVSRRRRLLRRLLVADVDLAVLFGGVGGLLVLVISAMYLSNIDHIRKSSAPWLSRNHISDPDALAKLVLVGFPMGRGGPMGK